MKYLIISRLIFILFFFSTTSALRAMDPPCVEIKKYDSEFAIVANDLEKQIQAYHNPANDYLNTLKQQPVSSLDSVENIAENIILESISLGLCEYSSGDETLNDEMAMYLLKSALANDISILSLRIASPEALFLLAKVLEPYCGKSPNFGNVKLRQLTIRGKNIDDPSLQVIVETLSRIQFLKSVRFDFPGNINSVNISMIGRTLQKNEGLKTLWVDGLVGTVGLCVLADALKDHQSIKSIIIGGANTNNAYFLHHYGLNFELSEVDNIELTKIHHAKAKNRRKSDSPKKPPSGSPKENRRKSDPQKSKSSLKFYPFGS